MENRFDPAVAGELPERFPDLPENLALRVYTTRLLGAEKDLVLHGGGNTSVKMPVKGILGEERQALFVKGSGRDMALMEPEDFARLDLEAITRLRVLDRLSDQDEENQLVTSRLYSVDPFPSVDAWVHAFLPHTFVDHTHADAILILTNQEKGEELIRDVLGPKAAVIEYIHPGFGLGKAAALALENHPDAEALIVRGHGIFTFGNDAETAYGRMIDYVSRAEDFILKKAGFAVSANEPPTTVVARLAQAVRGAAGRAGGKRFQAEICTNPELVAASLMPEAESFCQSGVLTPDHVIRAKNEMVWFESIPGDEEALKDLVSDRVKAFIDRYTAYFEANADMMEKRPEMSDPVPRVFFAAGIGMITLGRTRREAIVAADIAERNVLAKVKALSLGRYQPLSAGHIFSMEYWPLQRKKLGKEKTEPLRGQVALVTGAGGAIGFGIAGKLLEAGAAVVLSDIDRDRLNKVEGLLGLKFGEENVAAVSFDVTDYDDVARGFDEIARRFGGLDLVVPNAGVALVARIDDLDPAALDKVMAVNFKGVFNTIKASAPVFKRQGTGGNIVIISSKNVFDPGAAFSAYSSSKAAAHQMGKIAAMEFAPFGVRVNLINPDAVFGCEDVSSKLWDTIGPDRMRSRGLDPECMADYYHDRNLLKAKVTADHVGNAVVFFAADQTPTTGATLPVDGGVQGAFPR